MIAVLVAAALALWGWSGMLVEVEYRDFGWGAAARAWPSLPDTPIFQNCLIEINTYYPPQGLDALERTILHEVGHCVGYWPNATGETPHSDNPESIMYYTPRLGQGEILREDLEWIKVIRDRNLSYRVTFAY